MEQSSSPSSITEIAAGSSAGRGAERIAAVGIWRHYPGGRFGQGRGPVGLIDVSVTLHAGELVCICGHSGQGKSTLLRIRAIEAEPSEGRFRCSAAT
jgi:ABC-type glutathione transport system ATPase component